MSDKLNEAIQEIAIKHGMVLSKDDPILILHTMNERLLEENRNAQEQLLAQFKEDIQKITLQWQHVAKEKAEKILNAALVSSKEAIAKLLQDSVKESIHTMKKLILSEMTETRNPTIKKNNASWFILALLTMLVTVICFSLLCFICMN